MRGKRMGFPFVVLLILWVFLALPGCQKQPEEKAEVPAKRTLRIGYQPSTHQVAHMVAMEKGWWLDELGRFGVEDVKEFQFPSGPPEMTAMMAGELDVAYVGATPPLSAMYEGLKAKIVAAAQTQGSALILQPGIPYEGPASLKGLKIGTFPPGSIQHTVLKKWLGDHAIDMEKELDVSLMGPGDILTAMKSKALDGAFLPHPGPAILELEQSGKVVLDSGQMWREHACCVLVLSDDLIRNHPDLAQQIVNIHIKTSDYVNGNTAETMEIFANKMKMDLATVKHSFDTWDGTLLADPYVVKRSVLDFSRTIYDLSPGRYEAVLAEDDVFDFSFYDKASNDGESK